MCKSNVITGDNGKPVIIDKKNLTSSDRKKYDDGWLNQAYNEYVSEMISLHRPLPDGRDEE